MSKILSQNPATEEVIKEFDELSQKEIEKKLSLAQSTYEKWSKTIFAERAELMRNLAKHLKKNNEKYGELITKEMGKPFLVGVAEIDKCADHCEYYAEHTEKFLSPELRETSSQESYVRFDPLGAVLAVMPWNFPFWQVLRFAVPAVMAGNTALLKHASNVPQNALAIEEAFLAAGFPKGVFQTLLIGASKVESIIRDPRVKAVTLTGSEKAGAAVASVAGQEVKKTVLELGGSDPFIVLSDANIVWACAIGASARLQNGGQSCIAAKRFIVVESIYDEFIEQFKLQYEHQVVGDPMEKSTTVGPMATKQILDDVARQVEDSIRMGAEVIIGGKRVDRKGYFYEPTILGSAKKGMPIVDEEVFGPAAAVIRVKDEAEAIRAANDSDLGLGASLWTRDLEKAKKLVQEIEAGVVFVNEMVVSDPRMPFGGIKKSGYGRELSEYGIREFVNIKAVRMSEPQAPSGGVAIE